MAPQAFNTSNPEVVASSKQQPQGLSATSVVAIFFVGVICGAGIHFIVPGSRSSEEPWDKVEGNGGIAPCWKDIRSSCALDKQGLKGSLSHKTDYDDVLKSVAQNVHIGEFTLATWTHSWRALNAITNFYDKTVAPLATRMLLDVIAAHFKPEYSKKVLVVGMELVGGIVAGQSAALAPSHNPSMLEWCDFAYFRKFRKTDGTLRQLEGPNHIGERTVESPPLRAVFLDDVQSSGSTLKEAAETLKREYNIDVVGAVFLVDRPNDRKELDDYLIGATDPILEGVKIVAIYDIKDIDAEVQRNVSGLVV